MSSRLVSRRRAVAVAATVAVAGCLTEAGRRCRGNTVRLSMQPTTADDPLGLSSLGPEATGVIETARDGTHVEHCVVWEPSGDETGPSPGLAAVVGRLVDDSDRGPPAAGEELAVDVEYEQQAYRLVVAAE
ncbi:uncharacterized protein NP_5286A [Natronomonas pharaonis DSM 2160]|uniref:Uncharacterized protein n=1 Tax=Natronomonas pharaonis (strain ATCC 35678 / DSM 2160 / CIP 103997 / JCM 8858 / NBRC 14720 / NCIMB 2260 / Gabara) TaxID=348780 RepID=A0A1U7EZL3_NATPD|nr:hypothetical protein [Natronomonas pharaonis]CAI50734.2 uncharacterized protein NP_5286A [Natronomonas pharaonis DSM 2160]